MPEPASTVGAVDQLQDAFCPNCGYSLRGLTADRCPECGTDITPVRSHRPQIPWVRATWWTWPIAYWRTVLGACRRPRRLCSEFVRPIDYGAARRFQLVSVLHGFVGVLLLIGWLAVMDPAAAENVYQSLGPTLIVVILSCLGLSILAITGAPSYFFHPRHLGVEQQNRAIALSCYGSAAWGWLPLSVAAGIGLFYSAVPIEAFVRWLIGLVGGGTVSGTFLWVETGVILGGGALAILPLLLWWLDLLRIARHTLRSGASAVKIAVLTPLISVLLLVLIAGGIPAAVFFVQVVWYSLA